MRILKNVCRGEYILLIPLLLAAVLLISACDDDDPTGPDDQDTPVPATATPVPTETPEPSSEPDYEGRWYGYVKTQYPANLPDERVWFTVTGSRVWNGEISFWVFMAFQDPSTRQYHEYFETGISGNTFIYSYFEGNYFSGFRSFNLSGVFDSDKSVAGSWMYSSGAAGEDGPYGYGTWFAGKLPG
ncbi:hypothetical protein JXA40_11580 [bacterium]|nr:hypothetical protein [candidate division CSSED10-310 bacterium]